MLLIDEQYELALDPILDLMSMDEYNKMKGTIFMGVYEEKKSNDPEKSRYYYEEGLRLAEVYDERADYVKAYAYIGLSRYFEGKGDARRARAFRKRVKNSSSSAYFL
jgi:hypothetical protein